jgi:hypothetical protein
MPLRLTPAAIAAALATGVAVADVTVHGEVGGQTWSAASGTHYLDGDVTIAPGTKLTVLPGTVVVAKSGDVTAGGIHPARVEIVVRGELEANGATFRSESLYCGATTSCYAAWHGIVVESEATAVSLRDAAIANARFAGVHYRHAGAVLDLRGATLSNISGGTRLGPNIEGAGVLVESGSPAIDAATFDHAGGVIVTGSGRPLVMNCAFSAFPTVKLTALAVGATDPTPAAPVRFPMSCCNLDFVRLEAGATAAVEIVNNEFVGGGVVAEDGSTAALTLANNLYSSLAHAGNVAPGPGSVEGAGLARIDRGTARPDVPHDRRGLPRPSGLAFDIGPEESARMVPGDSDGDGRSELFWRAVAPGAGLSWWRMEGESVQAANYLEVPAEWRIVAASDFDGDGKADLLWRRDTDGALYLWKLDGLAPIAYFDLGAPDPAVWALEAVADFDADGRADILWRRMADGLAYLWQMAGGTIREQGAIGTAVGTAWAVVGAGDLDGDGSADVLWRRASDGLHYAWRMAGRTIVSQHSLGVVDPAAYEGIAIADIDGDGVEDIVWRSAAGEHSAWIMAAFATTGSVAVSSPGAGYALESALLRDGGARAGVLWRDGDGHLSSWKLGTAGFASLPDPGAAWRLDSP